MYGHHHELIAASDTIAAVCRTTFSVAPFNLRVQMKSRAESLDADLDSLKVAFSELSRLAAEVSTERQSSPNGVVET